MQETKNKRLAILFIALCCMTATAFWLNKTDGAVQVDKDLFKDLDLKTIDQITLESKGGRVELKFNGAKWEVNNQFDADPAMIEVIFATLQQAEPKRLLAASLQDSITHALKVDGVKISLLSSGKILSQFYAGGNALKTQAYFCEGDDDPKSYLVSIPGYRVYVSGIFELPEKDWRNKYVFGFNWRNFLRLESKFPQNPDANFEIEFLDNFFTVQGLTDIDTAKVNNFLDDVSLLTVNEYTDQEVFPDSLSRPSPTMVLTVKDIAQRAYTLQLYPPSGPDQPIPGLLNGVQWAYFNPDQVRQVFKVRAFFAK